MNIHRAKLRWSPKLGHITRRRICPSIRDRLRRWREAVNAVTLRDDNRPKITNPVCWGGVCVTVRVPVAFRNKCERVTGPQPERFRSIFPDVNATRTSGTGPERDRNANRNRCEHGLRILVAITVLVITVPHWPWLLMLGYWLLEYWWWLLHALVITVRQSPATGCLVTDSLFIMFPLWLDYWLTPLSDKINPFRLSYG